MMSWVRRKRLEAQLLAAELAKLLGGGGRSAPGASNGRMHSDDVLKMMGISL